MSPRRPVPQDPVLPHLVDLVDPSAMATRFARLLSSRIGSPVRVKDCDIERVKYRPGRNCVVGYLVQGEAADLCVEQRLCVATYASDEAEFRYEKARTEDGGRVVDHVRELDALVRMFPHDRKLPHLPLLADGATMVERYLPPLVAARWGDGRAMRVGSHAVLGYFPEHSCTVVLQAQLDSPGEHWRVFGKTRYDDAGEQTHCVMTALWTGEACQRGEVGYARPLGYDASQRLLWQEGIAAPTLHALLCAGPASPGVLRRVARAVAALHGTQIASPRRILIADLLAALDRAGEIVKRACPPLAGSLNALLRNLTLRSRDLDDTSTGALHGDLHSKNILVASDRAWLIDLDRLSIGPRLSEVGGLLAELAARDCATHGRVHGDALAEFTRCYREESGVHVSAEAVRWHYAAALILERAGRAVTSLKPGWNVQIPRLIDAARAALAPSPSREDASSRHGAPSCIAS